MSRLLREYVSLSYSDKIIEEARVAKVEKKPLVLKAILQRASSVNQNGRIYPKEILVREVENYSGAIAKNRSGGQLDHPESSVVELQNVSHKVKDIWWENDVVWGKVEINPSFPKGMDALGLIEGGLMLGISSRGVGDTIRNEDGNDVVDESFMLVAFDLVSEPSTHEAWLMKEGREITLNTIEDSVSKIDRLNYLIKNILRK